MEELTRYKENLKDFQDALESEKGHDEKNESMIRLLREEIVHCEEMIKKLENV